MHLARKCASLLPAHNPGSYCSARSSRTLVYDLNLIDVLARCAAAKTPPEQATAPPARARTLRYTRPQPLPTPRAFEAALRPAKAAI